MAVKERSTKPTAHTAHERLGLQLFVGLLACVVGLMVFGLLAQAVITKGAIIQLDHDVSVALHADATPGLTQFFLPITLLGLQGLWVVVVIMTLYYAIKRQRGYLIAWLGAFIGAELLDSVIKLVVARPRPVFNDPILTAANYSFPSGHAMVSMVMYGLLAFFILLHIHNAMGRIAVILATIILVLLIGVSRIYLGVHYFSDVAAGYAAGAAWLAVCISAMDYFMRRGGRKTEASESPSAPLGT